MPAVVLLLGSADFTLDEKQARLLVEWIRQSVTADIIAEDERCRACADLADAIEARIMDEATEPIDVGRGEASGLYTYTLRDFLVEPLSELGAFYYAVARLLDQPVLPPER